MPPTGGEDAAEAWLRLAGDWMKLAEAAERRWGRFDPPKSEQNGSVWV